MKSMKRPIKNIGMVTREDNEWVFRAYLVKSDPSEIVNEQQLCEILRDNIKYISSYTLSDEFDYLKTGFAIAHYGRRGIAHCFWHWAEWGGTWECITCSWYCYGRQLDRMEILDSNEPVFSNFEWNIIKVECDKFFKLAEQSCSHKMLFGRYVEEN